MTALAVLAKAREISIPPPPGAPYSVPVDGSEQTGRSKIYRLWRFKDALLQTLDPQVTSAHDFFETTGEHFIQVYA
jgi:long-chain acyl-CoA synthetase